MRRSVLVPIAVTTCLAGALAACTSEQQSSPPPTLTSTTTTSTTVADTVATTEAPVESTAIATTEATTTTTTLPPGPADASVPLLIGGAQGGWLSLGGWRSDRWEDAYDDEDQPIAPSIASGAAVSVVTLDGEQPAEVGNATEACFDGRQGVMVDPGVPAPRPPGFGYGGIAAVTPEWNLTPRPIAVTATGPDSYRELGADIFANQPVDASNGSVQQVVIADLDGDGDDEAVVSFEFVQPTIGPGTPGDFAAVFVVDTDSRTASTVLENSIDAGLPTESFQLIERFRVLGVADFNGDGRMEVAVHAWYYEGASVLLYEYDGTTLTEVLANGCGA